MDIKNALFSEALEGQKIPILTLDHRWHRLFTQTLTSSDITQYEKEVNELLKEQGKDTNELKEIKRIKAKLMNDIVESMNDSEEQQAKEKHNKKTDNKRLIEECNRKIDEIQDRLLEVPKDIDRVNKKLMLATMEECYQRLQGNSQEIKEIETWISQIRVELKKKVIRKQEKELWNFELYSYMHDLFGKDVLDLFDMTYDPLQTPPIVSGEAPRHTIEHAKSDDLAEDEKA